MYRRLLIAVAGLVLCTPGIAAVVTNTATAPAAPPGAEAWPSAPPSTGPSAGPSASPSPSDVTPPVTTASGADSRWHRTAVTVRLAAMDDASGVASTWFSVDGGTWAEGDRVTVPAPAGHANDGEHVIAFFSVDGAANREAPKTVTVKIDTRAPVLRWRSVSPRIIYRTRPVVVRFHIAEASGPVRLTWRVDDQYGRLARLRRGLRRDAGVQTLDLVPRYRDHRPFLPGVYRVTMRLEDEAGNVSVSRAKSFRSYRPERARVWYSVPGSGRRVALTFDDGGSQAWASILKTLKTYHAHATFFPLGSWAAASPALMRRTIREGHTIGSHGWTHAAMSSEDAGRIVREWRRTIGPWWRATRCTPLPYCRPPFGDKNDTVLRASGSAGFCRIIAWDVDPADWKGAGSGAIAAHVLSHVHPGAIVCMHLLPRTAAALPAILQGLRARGYRVASLAEMFRAAGYR